ncbi:hypothetical protein FEM48_Zijuj02G0209900 [Ziziphus jujuba var. spinosa]|uniref:NADP-dependent oxidoreductase domain-containing protein n=1 Tax=Ziziphus jujuba var. spinosa TaxID=714518 RepID=A0A978VXX5_ZIZJJ|nr:hypothetical protein FEM48_Zijuj02G0209900 [Ziziphus jujuba var. spinosa]
MSGCSLRTGCGTNKFIENLGCATEWKFTFSRVIGDGKRGSLYLGAAGVGGCWIMYKVSDNQKHKLAAYELMSANDAPETDPMDWVLEGSNDGGSTWHLLDERISQMFDDRFQRRTFKVASIDLLSDLFRFRFLAVRDVNSTSRELGIGIVPYSPLGRGFFAGKAVVESLPADSFLVSHPRFLGENLNKNKIIYDRIETLARKHHCSPAQLALAWVLEQGDDVVPIPGTTKIKNLDDNIGSVRVKLTAEDLKEISDAVPIEEVAGSRTYGNMVKSSWNFANTPPKESKYDGVKVPTVKLGNQGLEVSKLGCGCMRLSDIQSEEDGILIIKEAFNKGITYFDTADLYGAHSNELLVGKALKQLPRQKIQLSTKFGIVGVEGSGIIMGELKKLVEEGKIKYIGLSEASPDTIRRAHAVHLSITALQMEWSLWTREY